eukprot:TRINITY_DN1516_c0_g1_i1.p1 TRINITY_DN1516_c0_g1~~TRINITY_DN1516_c0_g1_i1.p1  ORF type:complete len:361 (+),score=120.89 TRINITY_DN1516_c0_g1_i1:46-1128(+)
MGASKGDESSLRRRAQTEAHGSRRLISHVLPNEGKILGAAALLGVMCSMGAGPMVPMALLALVWCGWWGSAAVLFAVAAYPFVVKTGHNPAVARAYLKAGGWFRHGVTAWFEEGVVEKLKEDNGSLWCLHPHGTSVGMGFTLNGAIRFKAERPEKFLPAEVQEHLSEVRLKRMSGVMATVLFKIPFVRPLLLSFGCCQPATKKEMFKLFSQRSDFGILPGGMEEVYLAQYGKERVYIAQRKGFIKYALQHGYLIVIGYTFGESDLYRTSHFAAPLRQWLMKRFGFVVPLFWGPRWYCPVLPDDSVPVNTVLGSPLQLPTIPAPTPADVAKYHQQYVDALRTLFDTHKHQFGYGDRSLEVH